MKKLLWVGDAGSPTGFARATHEILNVVQKSFEVNILGINYRGDPHSYPYPIWAAAGGGDAFGILRLPWMCDKIQPDVIVIQQDGWNIDPYLKVLNQKNEDGSFKYPEFARIPVVGAIPVDGKNFQGPWIKGLSAAVFWTQFALNEARAGGYRGPATVIPLGVDVESYKPLDRYEARLRRGLPKEFDDTFIVGNVNRNQSRKRWDLTIGYFAKWIRQYKIPDAFLFLHSAPTGDTGINVGQLSHYYKIPERVLHVELPTFYGVSETVMRETYNCFDVQITTTQGEGFGLTTFEGMACGIPQIVPDWSALGELCQNAVVTVPCTSTAVGAPYVNVVGGVADEKRFIEVLNALYQKKDWREQYGKAGLERVHEPQYRWSNIGERWIEFLTSVVDGSLKSEETSSKLVLVQ